MIENKGFGKYDEFVSSLESFIDALNAAKDSAGPELEKALQQWAVRVEQDAKKILARPNWILQESITKKVLLYQEKKIWAMAGFRFQNKTDKRSPGYYGRFHEAGWAPDRKTIKVPSHFLRQAKTQNIPQLNSDITTAIQNIMEIIKTIMAERRAATRRKKK